MAPSFCIDLNADARLRLLRIARRSIRSGFDSGRALALSAEEVSGSLAVKSAVFITLTKAGKLRGCVGSLEPRTPLAQAVASAAYGAAFNDRRFDPLRDEEIERLHIEISVLSPMLPIEAVNRQELLEILEPGTDGLLIEDRGRRATFLPKVWDKIASPQEFVEQLLQKAELPAQHWSDSIRCYRYRALSFAET